MPAQIKHPLSPWGKQVKIRLIQRDMDEGELSDLLRAQGFHTTRTTIIGMMRGYRGARAHEERRAINVILDITETLQAV